MDLVLANARGSVKVLSRLSADQAFRRGRARSREGSQILIETGHGTVKNETDVSLVLLSMKEFYWQKL